jgi:hypothetical protein
MTTFDSREQAFENKFVHDLDQLFRIQVRRARLLGEWAAGRLGLSGPEADAYGRSLAEENGGRPGGAGIVDRVCRDFEAKGIDCSRHRVEREAEHLLAVARDQIMTQ